MKDNFTSSETNGSSDRDGLMLPVRGQFTRPRRFGSDQEKWADRDMVVDHTPAPADAVVARHNRADLSDRDLWTRLEMQRPGPDQFFFDGGQAMEDFRATDVSKAFDILRTRLRQTTKQHGWVNIAVAAPTSGCGNTFTAVNLAASLSRIPSSRTVLVDFNMRKPGVAKALDMKARKDIGLDAYLDGRVGTEDYMVRASDTLAVCLADAPQHNAAEIMQDPATAATLAQMRASLRPDVVIYDMPPLLSHDDTAGFLPQLDGVLLVSDGTQTMAKHIAECERILDGHVPLLGVILNRARASSIERF